MTTLAPSQQHVCDAIVSAWPYCSLFHLWSSSGCGRSTLLQQLHQQFGGIVLSPTDFVTDQIGRESTALEDTIFCVIRRALERADVVLIDDWQLLANVVSGCGDSYPRTGYLDAVSEAIAELVLASGKKLLISSDRSLPDPISVRCYAMGFSEFNVVDYEYLCGEFGGDSSASLDYGKIHRFAPRLNGYQLRKACEYAARENTWDTESVLDYLREQELASNVQISEVATSSFEDLIGVDDVLASLTKHIVLPLENDDLALELDLHPKRGVLLLGPPGTGKTTIGKALAHRLKGKFFLIDGTVISGTESFYHKISWIFAEARDNAPSVIFIDDSDVIFENRKEHGLYRYLLTKLDGLEGKSNGRVCVILTAMELQHIPPALMRSGRVELWLQMGYPDRPARHEVLRRLTAALPDKYATFDLSVAANLSDGCSGADLKRLVNDAKALLAWDLHQQIGPRPFTEYFEEALTAFHEQRANYAVAEERGRQRGDRPVWFDVPTSAHRPTPAELT